MATTSGRAALVWSGRGRVRGFHRRRPRGLLRASLFHGIGTGRVRHWRGLFLANLSGSRAAGLPFVWVLPFFPLIRIVFLLALMAAFYAGFALYRLDHPAGRFLLPIAFLWMAFVFWAFCAGMAVELWNLAARTLPLPLSPLAPMKQLLLMGAVCALAFLGSVWEAHTLRIRRVTLPSFPPPPPPCGSPISRISTWEGFPPEGTASVLRKRWPPFSRISSSVPATS